MSTMFERTIEIQNGAHEISVTTNRAASRQHIKPDYIFLSIGPMFMSITAEEADQLSQALTVATDPARASA